MTHPLHGTTAHLALDDIEVSALRQRGDDADTTDLQEALAEFGQLQPIVVTPAGKLIAGGRRVAAARALKWPTIHVLYVDAEGLEESLLEYTENSARKALTWQEECLAVRQIHNELCAMYPEWSNEKTAQTICVSRSHVSTLLQISNYYLKHPDKCAKLTLNDVLAKVRHAAKLVKATVLDEIEDAFLDRKPATDSADVADALAVQRTAKKPKAEEPEAEDTPAAKASPTMAPTPTPAPAPKPDASPELFSYHLLNADCYEFATSWTGTPFNFLHLDPPYGMNVNASDNQLSAKSSIDVTYSDTDADFQQAIDFWIASPPANAVNLGYCTAVVWHNPSTWPRLKAAAIAGGWEFMEFPFVAHKTNNSGVIPNPSKDFRRTYEQAMFLYRGTQVVENLAASVGVSFASKGIHTTEKPVAALQHIFRGLLFQHARVLDPYSGSGSALVGLMEMHERVEVAIGLELEPKFHGPASAEVAKRYSLLKASYETARKRLASAKDNTPKPQSTDIIL